MHAPPPQPAGTPGAPAAGLSTGPAAPPASDAAAAGRPVTAVNRRRRNVGWQSSDVIRAAALVIFMYLGLRLLWFAQVLVFTIFLAVLFGLAVSRGVDFLHRWRIPRGIAAAAIVFGSLGLLGGLGVWMAPTLREQSAELKTKLPEAAEKIEQWVARRSGGMLGSLLQAGSATRAATSQAATGATRGITGDTAGVQPVAGQAPAQPTAQPAAQPGTQPSAPSGAQPGAQPAPGAEAAKGSPVREKVMQQVSGARRYVFGFVTSTIAAIGGLILVIFLAIYIAADPETYHRGMMHLFPFKARRRAGEVLSAIALVLRKWLLVQLIAMLVIGGVTTVALLILGVEAALPLGLLAGLFEFIPTVGPVISSIPAIAMGFVDSPEKALTIALVYMGIQFMENHLLIPMLMKEGVDLPPAMTIIAQALMALVFGFIGLLVAVPALAAATVAVKMLYVQDVVGDDVQVIDDDDDD